MDLEEEVSLNTKDKRVVDLEFSTRRVTDYIVQYSDFISLSTQYYQKFNNIIMGYDNEDICRQQLPRQFIDLRTDVQTTLQKFNNTYNLPELKGSRLKDLLYGI